MLRFTGSVKLKALVVMGGSDGQHPDRMRLLVQHSVVCSLSIVFLLFRHLFLFPP